MPMPFYKIPSISLDSGLWLIAEVDDAGTPLGDEFPIGATVYVRNSGKLFAIPGGAMFEYHALILEPRPARRGLSGTQVLSFTRGTYSVAPNQDELSARWDAMDPPHAGYLEAGVPRYYRKKRVVIVDTTPVVSQEDWEADWGPDVIELERRNLNPPDPLSPEERQEDIDDCLAHESDEHDESYDGEGGACDLFPYAAPADLDRVARERQGLMHVRAIGDVEGFQGPGAELLYYAAFKALMIKKGFKEAATWGNVTT